MAVRRDIEPERTRLPDTESAVRPAPPASPPAWRVRAYRAGLRLADGARSLAAACDGFCEAVSLGLLRPQDVDAVVAQAYASEPDFYDPDNFRPPYAAIEAEVADDLLHRVAGRRLLDAFCGQGREAATFAARGFEVTGIDRVPEVIERARERAAAANLDARFLVADFESWAPTESYDVVFTSAWMYSTFQGRERRARFLERCRTLCAPQGVIVISYKLRTPQEARRYRLRHVVARAAAALTRGNRRVEPGDRLYYHLFWHHFDSMSVDEEIAAAELEVLRTWNARDGQIVFRVLRARTAGPAADDASS